MPASHVRRGDDGRRAALSTYLQGLRGRLARVDVPVLTVKPGFVDTAMTWGLLKPGSPCLNTGDPNYQPQHMGIFGGPEAGLAGAR